MIHPHIQPPYSTVRWPEAQARLAKSRDSKEAVRATAAVAIAPEFADKVLQGPFTVRYSPTLGQFQKNTQRSSKALETRGSTTLIKTMENSQFAYLIT